MMQLAQIAEKFDRIAISIKKNERKKREREQCL
jgi:hypothetical protein